MTPTRLAVCRSTSCVASPCFFMAFILSHFGNNSSAESKNGDHVYVAREV